MPGLTTLRRILSRTTNICPAQLAGMALVMASDVLYRFRTLQFQRSATQTDMIESRSRPGPTDQTVRLSDLTRSYGVSTRHFNPGTSLFCLSATLTRFCRYKHFAGSQVASFSVSFGLPVMKHRMIRIGVRFHGYLAPLPGMSPCLCLSALSSGTLEAVSDIQIQSSCRR